MNRTPEPIVVIGASAGGVEALLSLAGQLPGDFSAAVLVTMHIDAYDSQMPALMTRRGPLTASYATAGASIEPDGSTSRRRTIICWSTAKR